MTLQRIICLIVFALVGGLVGWVYFRLMRRTVDKLVSGGGGAGAYLAAMLPRMALFVAGVAAAALIDPLSVISYLLAFLAVRSLVVARLRTAPPAAGREDG